jgi:hypothetical protein
MHPQWWVDKNNGARLDGLAPLAFCMKLEVVIHLCSNGVPLCRFRGAPTWLWPIGHISVPVEEYEVNAAACHDVDHELHAFAWYGICFVCEGRHLNHSDLQDLPVVPSEGRTCEHCKAPLVPAWPGVYCSDQCALEDA